MIFTWSRGRLGNQFFQYALAMEARQRGESVIMIGFDDLAKHFPQHLGLLLLISNRLASASRKVHRKMKRLAARGWIGSIDTRSDHPKIVRTTGKLPIFLVIDELAQINGLVQTKWVSDLVEPSLILEKKGINSPEFCFIHVRRTDYAGWPRPDIPAILPSAWFEEAIALVRKVHPTIRFKVFSDDPQSVFNEPVFRDHDHFHESEISDWLEMARGKAGILSPSSYAYWASLVSRELFSSSGPFIAPKYWGGWQVPEWYPPGLEDSDFTFLEVKQ